MVEPGTRVAVFVEAMAGRQLEAATGQIYLLDDKTTLAQYPHRGEIAVIQADTKECPCGCHMQYWKIVEEEN